MSTFGAQTQPSTNIFGNTQSGQTTGGSIFGNPSGQPSTSGTSPFGTTGTATNTAAGTSSGGLFGNTTMQQQPAGTNSFGNTGTQQQQQPAPGLFGNPTTAQQPGTGGLFGSTNTQTQPAATNMFGTATTQPAGGMFGNAQQQQQQPQTSTQPSTTIFGNPTTATSAPGGGMFGNTSTQQQQQPASGGLFGNTTTTQQPATGGLFGNTNPQTQPAGANLFGNAGTQQQQQQQPQTTGGGLFGSTNTSSNPLFGNKNPASIFGTAPTTSSTAPNLFGQPVQAPAAPSLFGQSQQQAPSGSLFGSMNQPTQNTNTGGLFGSMLGAPASNNLLASRSTAPAQQQDPQSQYAALEQKIQAIVQAWNPASPECRFQHYFYNLVPPEQVSAFGRPANATNEMLWQRAVRDNPDPSCMVPVLAVGFDDLRQRVDGQSKQATEQQKGLMELKKRLESLSAKHNDNNASRLQRAKSLQSQIQHRLLCLIQHMHLMLPTVRSTAIRPEEDALRVALEEIEEDIKRPGGMSKMRGKLNELWALVGAINAARERGRKAGLDGSSDWTVVDEEGLKQIAQILSNQQAGLQHLTKVLQKDLRDLDVIYGKES
ncbi:hypothetical protein K503DRAFT_689925 [Rhizopogon vinicolor AM-OR11-026]|uniref:Nucleoporin Nup54 alpha-helical domain-containing protein n=1 Tax=Rhizopogon vinicolor AM-OR11-026 TaxID=1314800 RepID=A0A1B7N368_9AGAM|nr:hypothetical protein K503DRAFT_689925 [Rhizopogon vinicolor AM-OR11-026]